MKFQGPIVRIAPDEVHISDPSFTETILNSPSHQQNKYAPHQNQFGMPQSTFNTIDSHLHQLRRGALASFFSRRSILALEPMLKEKVEKTCARLAEARGKSTAIDLRLLFSCMTTDIITEYAFPHCFNLLDTPDLSPAWRNTFAEGLRNFQWFKHFPILWKVLRSIPDETLLKLSPEMKVTQDWENGNKKLVKQIVDDFDENSIKKGATHPTIFHEVLASDLPAQEKSYERLWQEGSAMIGAGVETTSNTLNNALYYLNKDPKRMQRLRTELEEAIPDANSIASWQRLETLPYLTAVIYESLRLALGSTSRFIRVFPTTDLKYGSYTLPAGTAISTDALAMHYNSQTFPDPTSFVPERWLGKTARGDLLVFGKGPRMCAGINLAHAELYLTLATIVRRFDLELFDVDFHRDIEPFCDAFMPMPRADTKGVRVLVK